MYSCKNCELQGIVNFDAFYIWIQKCLGYVFGKWSAKKDLELLYIKKRKREIEKCGVNKYVMRKKIWIEKAVTVIKHR